jgi:hypothetical protein
LFAAGQAARVLECLLVHRTFQGGELVGVISRIGSVRSFPPVVRPATRIDRAEFDADADPRPAATTLGQRSLPHDPRLATPEGLG